MTRSEKLELMEALWADLSKRVQDVPIPGWHKEILDEREQQVAAGEAIFSDWDSAEGRVRKRVS